MIIIKSGEKQGRDRLSKVSHGNALGWVGKMNCVKRVQKVSGVR